jgi:hypothetical protein
VRTGVLTAVKNQDYGLIKCDTVYTDIWVKWRQWVSKIVGNQLQNYVTSHSVRPNLHANVFNMGYTTVALFFVRTVINTKNAVKSGLFSPYVQVRHAQHSPPPNIMNVKKQRFANINAIVLKRQPTPNAEFLYRSLYSKPLSVHSETGPLAQHLTHLFL